MDAPAPRAAKAAKVSDKKKSDEKPTETKPTRETKPAAETAHNGVPLDQPLREARDQFERVYFEFHLARENYSMTRVADRAGLERTHLYRKLKQLGIELARGARRERPVDDLPRTAPAETEAPTLRQPPAYVQRDDYDD